MTLSQASDVTAQHVREQDDVVRSVRGSHSFIVQVKQTPRLKGHTMQDNKDMEAEWEIWGGGGGEGGL